MEEVLFSRRENEICSAIYTLKNAILKLRHINPVPAMNLSSEKVAGFDPATVLFSLPARFLPVSLASQRLLGPALLTRLQIIRVPLNFLDDVFLLHLSFEAAKGVLQCFALLKLNFSQTNYTSLPDHDSPCA